MGTVPILNSYVHKDYFKPGDPKMMPQDDLFSRALNHVLQVGYAVTPLLVDNPQQFMTDVEFELYQKRLKDARAGLHGLNVVFDDLTKLRSLHWYNMVSVLVENSLLRLDPDRVF